MKNLALIIAGGVGVRTGQDIPKQFITIHDKPIIIYTLEAFDRHPNIDGIMVVCLKSWKDILAAYCRQYGISKVIDFVDGGETGQESIRNGVFSLDSMYGEEDIVLVHDAIRPLVSAETISDNIRVCREKGNAITVIPCTSAMLKTMDGVTSTEQILRDNLKETQTPQTFYVRDLADAHREAMEKGITDAIASCTLYLTLGKTVNFAYGSEKNVKITTAEDIEIIQALIDGRRPGALKHEAAREPL